MKSVLFISSQPFFQWRGSPIRVAFDVLALAELGYQVDLLTLPVGDDRDLPGVRVRRVPNLFRVRQVSIGPSLVKALFDILLLAEGLCLACRKRYAVVHGVEDAGAVAVAIAALTGSRAVFEKHSDPSSHRKGRLRNIVMRLYAAVERFTVRRAAATIGTGPGLVRQVRDMGPGVSAYHIFDIPSSLTESSPDACAAVRARLKKRESERLVAFVGSFAPYQGIDLMFEAIPIVVKRHPDARFIIIGGTDQEIAARKDALAKQGVAEAVSFLGKIPPDDLPDYLAAADVLLSPRLAGANTPLKLLDYLKAGSAILATMTEANRLILDESTALLVRPEPQDFADGLCRLLEDDALRARLAANGRKLIAETYNFAEFKRRLGRCYEDVLGVSGNRGAP